MTSLTKTVTAASLALGLMAGSAFAGDKMLDAESARNLVQPFYDLLGGDSTVAEAKKAFSPDWKSYYSSTGYKGLDATMGFVSGPLQQMVPDLDWKIMSVSVTDKNEIVVRGEATGTPAGKDFFGQPITGNSFTIMSIDVHTVKDGKIVKSYHIEDWAGALKQLAAGKKS